MRNQNNKQKRLNYEGLGVGGRGEGVGGNQSRGANSPWPNKQEGMWPNTGGHSITYDTHTGTRADTFSRTQSPFSPVSCTHNDGSESSPNEGMHLKPAVNPYYMCSVLSVWVRPINYE